MYLQRVVGPPDGSSLCHVRSTFMICDHNSGNCNRSRTCNRHPSNDSDRYLSYRGSRLDSGEEQNNRLFKAQFQTSENSLTIGLGRKHFLGQRRMPRSAAKLRRVPTPTPVTHDVGFWRMAADAAKLPGRSANSARCIKGNQLERQNDT